MKNIFTYFLASFVGLTLVSGCFNKPPERYDRNLYIDGNADNVREIELNSENRAFSFRWKNDLNASVYIASDYIGFQQDVIENENAAYIGATEQEKSLYCEFSQSFTELHCENLPTGFDSGSVSIASIGYFRENVLLMTVYFEVPADEHNDASQIHASFSIKVIQD